MKQTTKTTIAPATGGGIIDRSALSFGDSPNSMSKPPAAKPMTREVAPDAPLSDTLLDEVSVATPPSSPDAATQIPSAISPSDAAQVGRLPIVVVGLLAHDEVAEGFERSADRHDHEGRQQRPAEADLPHSIERRQPDPRRLRDLFELASAGAEDRGQPIARRHADEHAVEPQLGVAPDVEPDHRQKGRGGDEEADDLDRFTGIVDVEEF